MNKVIRLLCFFSFSAAFPIGFDGSTLVTMSSGDMKSISEISIGDEVVCCNTDLQLELGIVKGVYLLAVDSTIEITTKDNTVITASSIERFFVPKESTWVHAKDLNVGDCLLNARLEAVEIVSIKTHSEPQELYAITVDKFHNFLASESKYLVHNGPVGASVGFFSGKAAVHVVGHGTIALISGTIGLFCPPVGTAVGIALEGVLAVPIEVASNTVGVATGIALGTATGPV